jgi:hypothetical protein
MPVERHRSGDACMEFHFGLHRTSRANFSGSIPDRCDSTDLRKEIRLVADNMCYILSLLPIRARVRIVFSIAETCSSSLRN